MMIRCAGGATTKKEWKQNRRNKKGIYILHIVRITNVSFEVQYCENKWWLPGAKIQSLITSTLRIFTPSSSLVSAEAWKTDTLMPVFLVVNCAMLWPEFIFVLLCLANSLSCQTETQMYSIWKMSKSLYYRCAITLFVLYNNIMPEYKLQHCSQRLFSLWSLCLIFIRLHWSCDTTSFFKAERWTEG